MNNREHLLIVKGQMISERYHSLDELRVYINRLMRLAARSSSNIDRQWNLRLLAMECQNRLIDRLFGQIGTISGIAKEELPVAPECVIRHEIKPQGKTRLKIR